MLYSNCNKNVVPLCKKISIIYSESKEKERITYA